MNSARGLSCDKILRKNHMNLSAGGETGAQSRRLISDLDEILGLSILFISSHHSLL